MYVYTLTYLQGDVSPVESEFASIVHRESGGTGRSGGGNIVGGASVAGHDLTEEGVTRGEIRHRVRVPNLESRQI